MKTRLSAFTESLLRQRSDIEHLSPPTTDEPDDRLEFTGGPDYFADESIYDPVDDATATWLLQDFLTSKAEVGWNVLKELSKFLWKRGHLVHDQASTTVHDLAKLDRDEGGFTPWIEHQLCLSYLCRMEDGQVLAIRLLDTVPEDFRDGLLLACYRMDTPAIYEAVKAHVRQWIADIWLGESTGEKWLVHRMVQKWDRTHPRGDHDDIRAACAFD
jgi:hypothetical protein